MMGIDVMAAIKFSDDQDETSINEIIKRFAACEFSPELVLKPVHTWQDEDPKRYFNIGLQPRFYAPGYERGCFIPVLVTLGWLLRNFPNATVYHGSDLADELDEWTLAKEKEYLDHYLTVGHEPYRRKFQ